MTKAMMEQKQKERKFLEQLLDGKKVENYTIPVPIKAELRKYQQVSEWVIILEKEIERLWLSWPQMSPLSGVDNVSLIDSLSPIYVLSRWLLKSV